MPTPLCAQPVAGTQVSAVQMLLSSQFKAGPPTHAPFVHTSVVVHALLSSHPVLSGMFG
jgi:hypothetical protein